MNSNQRKPRITLYTQVYNVEKYINLCADSVLLQSFTDFEWLILDNASTDATSLILEEYAKRDSRIKIVKNKINSVQSKRVMEDIIKFNESVSSKYWCMLDGDDYLHVDYLKKMYEIAEDNNMDIVVSGAEMFLDNDSQKTGRRCPPDFNTKSIQDIGDIFTEIYGTFRPIWGKLIKTELVYKVLQYRKIHPINLVNGIDTYLCLDFLKCANSVSAINQVLYYHRVRNNSLYNSRVNEDRYKSYLEIYHYTNELLLKWGKLTPKNDLFIVTVLYQSIKDCLDVITKSVVMNNIEKIDIIEKILSDQILFKILLEHKLEHNLFIAIYEIITEIIKNMDYDESVMATTRYSYRLCQAINSINDTVNKHNIFLLYISALFDSNNKNLVGSVLFSPFMNLIFKPDLSEKFELFKNNYALFKEIINLHDDNINTFLSELALSNNDERINEILKSVMIANNKSNKQAKKLLEEYIKTENFDDAVDVLLEILNHSPLDIDALISKMIILSSYGDNLTLIETAEVLRVFYPDDITALKISADAFLLADMKKKALNIYKNIIKVCSDSGIIDDVLCKIQEIENIMEE